MLTHTERAYMRSVGEAIKRIRSEKGITQAGIYVRSGIAQNTISNYECGQRNPTLLHLLRLSEVLGCDLKELLP